MEEKKLMFQPFSSKLSPGFWHQLTSVKLNELKLNKGPIDLHGTYACNLSQKLPIPCLASFDHSSFNKADQQMEFNNNATCCLYGQLTCTNIIQEFNECVANRKEFIQEHGKEIWDAIKDGRALKEPEKYLSKFALLVYADLKKYKYVYFFSFPALNYLENLNFKTIGNILNVFSHECLQILQNELDNDSRNFSKAYFIVKHIKDMKTNQDHISIFSLDKYHQIIEDNDTKSTDFLINIYFAFSDPSSSQIYPGWPLRNFLTLIAYQFELKCIKMIRLRRGPPTNESNVEIQHSTVIEIILDPSSRKIETVPSTTGWELDGKSGGKPKRVDLSNHLNPRKLAEDAVNLNLRLMKWRLLPGLDLDRIASTKCLLLGCGTLGCHIARGLLAWGITNLSIVDNAKISYSNPVRQSLYTFEDCIGGAHEENGTQLKTSSGLFKAVAAEASLKKIHPTANVKSYVLSIPMPGHHVDEKELEQTRKDVELLENLIEEHDVVFLLMDTRESRWLPTVIAMSKQRLVINAAIGFDTFLLQRYGIRDYNKTQSGDGEPATKTTTTTKTKNLNYLESERLGCYFCNDIVAPGDSTLDRTLDQQCTVSRPGVSMMVSAMAVELLASIMSSSKLANTPAPLEIDQHEPSSLDDEFESELGIVPHSIRGSLARYYIYMPTSPSFEKCSACSRAVINAYREHNFEFLQKVFDDPSYLEEVAGLKDLQNVSDDVWALDSDEEPSLMENN